jgi:hypothetical protein
MPLQVAKPPVAVEKAIRSMLGRLIATDPDYVPALRSASPGSLAISTPHRIAVLDLNRIHSRMSLASAVQKKGWRFLVLRGEKVVATVNSSTSGTGKHGFSNITDGPFVSGTERAIRRAELLEPVQKGRFEPLLLQVPAIHVVALWLKNLDNESDLIMPISPAPKPLRPYHALVARDFIAAVTELAAQAKRDYAEARRPQTS